MKRPGVFCLTVFYLLLTTGTYACLLHCTTEYLLSKTGLIQETRHSAEDDDKGEQGKDDDRCGEDCTCCYHHGTYVVNENFNSSISFQFATVELAIFQPKQDVFHNIPAIINSTIRWPNATGPPFIFRQPIYISNHSLLI